MSADAADANGKAQIRWLTPGELAFAGVLLESAEDRLSHLTAQVTVNDDEVANVTYVRDWLTSIRNTGMLVSLD
jgi:hypothetical protein